MKKFFQYTILALLLITLTACGAPEASPTPTPTPTPSATVETTPVPSPTPSVSENLSLTTGLPTDKAYLPMAVMVENSDAARPQTGLQQADIIYEAMAEGGITRFLCIFNDQQPVKVGPIRSTRLYYIEIQREWDAPLVHYGGPSDADRPSYVYGEDSKDIKLRLDGLKGGYGEYFWRDQERKAPNNVYTDLTELYTLYDYTPDERDPFSFEEGVTYNGEMVDTVGLPFLSKDATHTSFVYDPETDLFTRYQKGEPFEVRTVTQDAEGNQETQTAPMTVKNLIVQYANTYTLKNDVKNRRMVDIVDSGEAEYFIGGKHVTGYWERTSREDSTHYYLEDGKPVVLRPGNTWIALQPNTDTVTVTYQ